MHFILLFFFLSFGSAKFYSLGFYAFLKNPDFENEFNLSKSEEDFRQIIFQKINRKLYFLPEGPRGGDIKTHGGNGCFQKAYRETEGLTVDFAEQNIKEMIRDFFSKHSEFEEKKIYKLFFFSYLKKLDHRGKAKCLRENDFINDLYLFNICLKFIDCDKFEFKYDIIITPFKKITLNSFLSPELSKKAYSYKDIVFSFKVLFKDILDCVVSNEKDKPELSYFKTSGCKRKNSQRESDFFQEKKLKTEAQNDILICEDDLEDGIVSESESKVLLEPARRQRINWKFKNDFIKSYDSVESFDFMDSLLKKNNMKNFYKNLNFSLEVQLTDFFAYIVFQIDESFRISNFNEMKIASLSIPYLTDSNSAVLDLCVFWNYLNSTKTLLYKVFWVFKEKGKKHFVSLDRPDFKEFKFCWNFNSEEVRKNQDQRNLCRLQIEERFKLREQIIQDLKLKINEFEQDPRFPEKFNKKISVNNDALLQFSGALNQIESDTKEVDQSNGFYFDLRDLLLEDQDSIFFSKTPESSDENEFEQERRFSEKINQNNGSNFDLEILQYENQGNSSSPKSSESFDGDELDVLKDL